MAFTARDGAIGSESRFLHTPLVFDAPVRGGVAVGMVWLPEDMFIHFDTIHERDRQTDGHTDEHRMTA